MMKKVIILLPLLALFLVGCAGTKVQPEPKVVIQKEIEKKLPLNIADPEPLDPGTYRVGHCYQRKH